MTRPPAAIAAQLQRLNENAVVFSIKNDFINLLDPHTRTPHNRPEFANTILEPDIKNGGIEGHIRVAQGPETNQNGVDAILEEISN